MFKNKLFLISCAFFFMVIFFASTSYPVLAKEDNKEEQIVEIMEMSLDDLLNIEVVSTTKTSISLRKAPGTIYRFDASDFINYGIQSLEDLYWYIPGVQPYRYKKNNVIAFRGVIERFNNRNQHIVDGVVIRNGYYNHEEIDIFFPLEWVDNMEVISGPGSSLYGANAFSGIISIKLLDFSEKPEIKVSAQSVIEPTLPIGTLTFRNKMIAFGLSCGSGKVATPEYNIDGSSFSQPDELKYYHAFFKLNLAGKGNFFVRHGDMKKPYLHNKGGRGFHLVRTPTIIGVDFHIGNEDKGGKLALKANYVNSKFAEDGEKGGEPEVEDQNASFTNIELLYIKNLNKFNLLIGTSYQVEKPGDIGIMPETLLENLDATLHNFSFFGQGILQFKIPLTLTMGLRYDFFNKFDNKLSERMALVYEISKANIIKFMVGTAIRTPSLREWDKDLEDTSFVQPPIEPEQLTTYELSFNRLLGNTYFDVTLFYNQFKKMLLQTGSPPVSDDPEGGGDEYFFNSEKNVSMKGLEFSIKYKTKYFNAYGGFSFIDTNNGDGNDIMYIRKHKFSLNFAYTYAKNHRITCGIIGFSGSNDDDTNDERYLNDEPGAFFYFNASLSGSINNQFSYLIGYRNITDYTVYDPFFLSSKYRNVDRLDKKIWASISYHFNL